MYYLLGSSFNTIDNIKCAIISFISSYYWSRVWSISIIIVVIILIKHAWNILLILEFIASVWLFSLFSRKLNLIHRFKSLTNILPTKDISNWFSFCCCLIIICFPPWMISWLLISIRYIKYSWYSIWLIFLQVFNRCLSRINIRSSYINIYSSISNVLRFLKSCTQSIEYYLTAILLVTKTEISALLAGIFFPYISILLFAISLSFKDRLWMHLITSSKCIRITWFFYSCSTAHICFSILIKYITTFEVWMLEIWIFLSWNWGLPLRVYWNFRWFR